MAREIKFRAWRIEEKELIYIEPPHELGRAGKDWFFCYGLEWADEHSSSAPNYENHVLMQFTGLKDKNGVDVYEGDIIKFLTHASWGIVVYEGVGFKVRFGDNVWSMQGYELEVIGNMYESPDPRATPPHPQDKKIINTIKTS